MLAAVDEVLAETGAGDTPRLLALNKVDLLDEERRRELSFRFPQAVQVSATRGRGLDDAARGGRGALPAPRCSRWSCWCPIDEGGTPLGAARAGGRARAQDTAEGVRVGRACRPSAAPRFERFSDERPPSAILAPQRSRRSRAGTARRGANCSLSRFACAISPRSSPASVRAGPRPSRRRARPRARLGAHGVSSRPSSRIALLLPSRPPSPRPRRRAPSAG